MGIVITHSSSRRVWTICWAVVSLTWRTRRTCSRRGRLLLQKRQGADLSRRDPQPLRGKRSGRSRVIISGRATWRKEEAVAMVVMAGRSRRQGSCPRSRRMPITMEWRTARAKERGYRGWLKWPRSSGFLSCQKH